MKFVIGLLAAVALLSVSCEKSKEQAKKTNPYEGEKMVFTLTVKNVEGDNASIQVKHNGKSKLTWYAFLSEDLDSSLEELVENNSYGLEPGELSVGARSRRTTVSSFLALPSKRTAPYGPMALLPSSPSRPRRTSMSFSRRPLPL